MESVDPGLAIPGYTVERELGRGGMGVVYLAVDQKLGRRVAIKTLSGEGAGQPDRLSRLRREARMLATLNHPNVAAIYGLEESDGLTCLILEYVEGATLAERLRGEPLSVEEAVAVCAQIAAGVAAAHEAGLVHRDLKPANVKITPAGRVKVLDFGLARSGDPASGVSGQQAGDTPTAIMSDSVQTLAGALLGTPGYMSPEQARGKPVDKRSDVFAFGCVLFECLTGRSAFLGATVADSLAAVLVSEADLSLLPPGTPQPVRELLEQCLRKDADRRARDMNDARLRLEDAISAARASQARPTGAPPSGTPVNPPSSSGPRLPNNLPRDLTTFIGREESIRELTAVIAGGMRLLTLTGSGGSGKTRLALKIATGISRTKAGEIGRGGDPPGEGPWLPSDGVWLVELGGLRDPSLVAQAVGAALQVREEPAKPLITTLVERLAEKRVLIVLDNCEHLLGMCGTVCEAILKGCEGVRILATSREALGIPGEQSYGVPSLSAPTGREMDAGPAELLGFEAVRLFVERARLAQPTFDLSGHSGPAVAQICRRLDGIPLAIELAAARVKAMTPDQIASRLDDSFRLLTGGSRTALPRQQTLRALIDWSYGLLGEGEKTLLRRLSVFSGGWTLEAAEGVCSDNATAREASDGRIEQRILREEILDLLSSLVDKSLVVYEAGRDGSGRYRLLEIVRQYTRDRFAETKGVDETRAAHLEYFAGLATEQESRMRGPEQAAAFAVLDREYQNMCAAMDHSLTQTGAVENGLRVGAALAWFWQHKRFPREGLNYLVRMDRATAGSEPTARSVQVRLDQVYLAVQCGDLPMALRSGDAAVAGARQVGDGRLLARTLNASGSARKNVGDHAGALERYAEAVGLVGESSAVAVLKNNMGECRWRLGDGVGARRLYEESMESSRASGHHLQEAVTLQNLVWVLVAEGSVDEAGTTQRRAAEIVRELNLEGAVPNMLEGMGAVSIASGGIERGATILGAASAARRTLVRPGAPNELCEFAPYLDRARREAGEAVFARAWSAGQAMKVEEAIAFAFSTNGERGAV